MIKKHREDVTENVWEQHEFLYHYTTRSGLEGILSTQLLHATHFKYLNDRNEMFHLKPKLVEVVRPSVRKVIENLAQRKPDAKNKVEESGGIEATSKTESETLIDVLYRISFGEERSTKFFQPYVVSFCGHKREYELKNGLLSQWRAYGGETGFAIVFRTKPLCDLLFREVEEHSYSACHIGDVVYDGNIDELRKEFGDFLSSLEELYPRIMQEQDPDITSLFRPFVSSTSRFKHRGFSEECEVRAVLSPVPEGWRKRLEKEAPEEYKKIAKKAMKTIKFRSGFVPYIEVGSCERGNLPIEKIIVGPSLVAENIKAKLESYLELKELQIGVTISETPLC